MKMKMIASIIAWALFASAYGQFKYVNLTKDAHFDIRDDLAFHHANVTDDLNRIKLLQQKAIQVSCLALIRNYLNSENTEEIKQTLANSKFSKGQTFDKIFVMIMDNCKKELKIEEAQEILTTDNILSFNSNYSRFLKFNATPFTDPFYEITFTNDEKDLIKDLKEVTFVDETGPMETVVTTSSLSLKEKLIFICIGLGCCILLYVIYKMLFGKKNIAKPEVKDKKGKKYH